MIWVCSQGFSCCGLISIRYWRNFTRLWCLEFSPLWLISNMVIRTEFPRWNPDGCYKKNRKGTCSTTPAFPRDMISVPMGSVKKNAITRYGPSTLDLQNSNQKQNCSLYSSHTLNALLVREKWTVKVWRVSKISGNGLQCLEVFGISKANNSKRYPFLGLGLYLWASL